MCGIAGFIDDRLDQQSARTVMESMLHITQHRGPDASHIWQNEATTLGHNRLSIIDLSQKADQPMVFENLVLTFNGEIYNYLEIKKELAQLGHRFVTASDSEVLLHAYAQWGAKCVEKFIGMWAFAIWDLRKKTLFCSRDRFGIKPFYFMHRDGAFYFGSEIKLFKPTRLFSNDLNELHVMRMLQIGWVTYEDETIFQCVNTLRPGENLTLQNGLVERSLYWSGADLSQERSHLGFDEAVEEFKHLFLESIDLHLRSDVPVGICLSGGIDSSSIASAVAAKEPNAKVHSFTAYYTGNFGVDERPWVQKVLDNYPSIEPHYYSPGDDELEDALERMLFHMDVPVAGSSPLSQYFVMKLVREQGIKVVLDGQGADEYLAGYMHSYYPLIGSHIRQGNLVKALRLLRGHYSEHVQGFTPKLKVLSSCLTAGFTNEQQWHAMEYKHKDVQLFPERKSVPFQMNDYSDDRLSSHLSNLIRHTTLPSLLHYEDRNSMAFSIESRVPFLNHKLVEFACSLPNEFKITKTTKILLRQSMSGLLPAAIQERKDKKGFVTPGEVRWLRGPLKQLVEINPKSIPFVDPHALNKLLSDYKKGDNSNARQVWRIAIFHKWLQTI